MPPLTATYEQAARWVRSDTGPERWNPVYRRLLDPPPTAPGADPPDTAALALLRRQLTAPALLTLALTDQGSTRRLRAALLPAIAGIETSTDDAPAVWETVGLDELPARLQELLRDAGIAPAAPHLTITAPGSALRLDETQLEQVRTALARGTTPEKAVGALTDPDPRLHDALTARGPRLSLSLTLHDPDGTVTERPVTFSRLWVRGDEHWYRLDADGAAGGTIHPVGAGDVLGTALPVLERGVRFAAARTSAETDR